MSYAWPSCMEPYRKRTQEWYHFQTNADLWKISPTLLWWALFSMLSSAFMNLQPSWKWMWTETHPILGSSVLDRNLSIRNATRAMFSQNQPRLVWNIPWVKYELSFLVAWKLQTRVENWATCIWLVQLSGDASVAGVTYLTRRWTELSMSLISPLVAQDSLYATNMSSASFFGYSQITGCSVLWRRAENRMSQPCSGCVWPVILNLCIKDPWPTKSPVCGPLKREHESTNISSIVHLLALWDARKMFVNKNLTPMYW